ncbi:MAG: L-rhamnose mutarotase [Clostridia bacterium]|nr:L-rhamnose mutarotase [Clostridia bacterium]
MIRKGSVMKLYHGMADEYKRRHDALWPEIIEAIHRDGGKNYTIFHDPETDLLFEYIEIENEEVWASRGGDEITKKWWDYMADIMETNADNSPVCRKINEVFHLE